MEPINKPGYYQEPTIWKDSLVFVCENDLWFCPLQGGPSQRLTAGIGSAHAPSLSPDGAWLAFTGTAEGHREAYIMEAQEGVPGGQPRRLTFWDEDVTIIGWTPNGQILLSSTHDSPFRCQRHIYSLAPQGGEAQKIPIGPARFLSFGPRTANGSPMVFQRHGYGYNTWKRYQGGTAAEIWIDLGGSGDFEKLLSLTSNTLRPLWIGERIYFLSDHEGHGNLYSCTLRGDGIQRHTHHDNFYAQSISTDGIHIVYSCQGSLWAYHVGHGTTNEIPIQHHSCLPEKVRKFENPSKFLTSYALSPAGRELALTTRGRLFRLTPWKGPATLQGQTHGVRYRLACFLAPAQDTEDSTKNHILVVKDQGLEEILEVYIEDSIDPILTVRDLDWGRILCVTPSPVSNQVLLTNHRHELLHLDLDTKTLTVINRDPFECIFDPVNGGTWSPDGAWVAYNTHTSQKTSVLRLCHLATMEKTDLTSPVGRDFSPCFDTEGKYIYFLSARTFSPVWSQLSFGMSLQKGIKPYLITLQKDTTSPFLPPTQLEDEEDKKKDEDTSQKPQITIDLDGIQDRILEFPVPEGTYSHIASLKSKVLYIRHEEDAEKEEETGKEDHDHHHNHDSLEAYDFSTLKAESLLVGIDGFQLSRDHQWIAYTSGHQLRVIKAGEKPEESDTSYRAGGLLDWNRVRLPVDPPLEWQHMFNEAWRLQKELFWRADMSNVDWDAVYARYRPLVDRVATTQELMDLIAEMQGELGSSHAFVWESESASGPDYAIGQLGARTAFDSASGAWRIESIDWGDPWNPRASSPLLRPGLNVQVGDLIWAIAGQAVSANLSPPELLLHQANHTIPIVVSRPERENKRTILVTPLAGSQSGLRYRDWVERNRVYVHAQTGGQAGYIHLPNMSAEGFSEFYRGHLLELDRKGLIIDTRFNRGGLISSLILEKLALRRLGLDQSRWSGALPYPIESPAGPMVALCNEYTASDGDIFCHSFKMLKLGPLIGKRTWGGVIGIWPRNPLIDGSMTAQPEYSFWFHDVGWRVENHGVDPDIEVDITPNDAFIGRDAQLDSGIEHVKWQIRDQSPDLCPSKPTEPGPDLKAPPLK